MTYIVTIKFIDGNLKGLTIDDKRTIAFEVGKTYGGGWTGPRYKVLNCREA